MRPMDNNPDEPFLRMHLDQDGGHILRETVRWSRFVSIVGFIALAVCLAGFGLIGTALFAELARVAPDVAGFGDRERTLIVAAALIAAAIFGFFIYLLYRFSVLTRRGIDLQDQTAFAEGMRYLKIYFVAGGILALLGLLANLFSITKLF